LIKYQRNLIKTPRVPKKTLVKAKAAGVNRYPPISSLLHRKAILVTAKTRTLTVTALTNPEVKVGAPIPEKEMSLKRGKLAPGAMVSIDQYTSTMPGRLPHTKGKEPKKDKYVGGTLFVDHATAYIYLRHQVSLRVGETLVGKHAFEQFAADHGVTIRAYRADNAPLCCKGILE
jgi:hypothetical protein